MSDSPDPSHVDIDAEVLESWRLSAPGNPHANTRIDGATHHRLDLLRRELGIACYRI